MSEVDRPMTLDEYVAASGSDGNLWWRLSSGHQMNLLDEAIDEIERLRAALAASCDENRSVALAEPGRTATCPLEQELRGEIERLKRLNATYVADHGEAQDQLQRERDEAREAARFLSAPLIEQCIDPHDLANCFYDARARWPWLEEE